MRNNIKGIVSLLFTACNTVLLCIPLYILAIIRFFIPNKKIYTKLSKWIDLCPETWICNNVWLSKHWLKVRWNIEIPRGLNMNSWYIVTSNHQSWTDPFAIHAALYDKIPFLKFFAKQEIMYIPFVNFACYASNFPILKRYSQKTLEKKPHLRKKDIETTLKTCENINLYPSGILNFSEGTRWTLKKYKEQNSPFKYLLKPKTGGIAYALLGFQSKNIQSILDVTILYPKRTVTFWDYMCGEVRDIKVVVREYEIPKNLLDWHYSDSEEYRENFRTWLYYIWGVKDKMIDDHLAL